MAGKVHAVTINLRQLALRLLLVVALVLFVFMLVASLRGDGTVWGQSPTTWLAAGLIAVMLDSLVVVTTAPASRHRTQAVAPPGAG